MGRAPGWGEIATGSRDDPRFEGNRAYWLLDSNRGQAFAVVVHDGIIYVCVCIVRTTRMMMWREQSIAGDEEDQVLRARAGGVCESGAV